jgi:hypothetical protein
MVLAKIFDFIVTTFHVLEVRHANMYSQSGRTETDRYDFLTCMRLRIPSVVGCVGAVVITHCLVRHFFVKVMESTYCWLYVSSNAEIS